MNVQASAPLREELMAIYQSKYCRKGPPGWGPRGRLAQDYFFPDDHYEALVSRFVQPRTTWLDVGCGRDTFPSHAELARELCSKAEFVAGVDPDDNINENPFVTERFQGLIEDYRTDRKFDLITMRMVAEHIVDPERTIRRIADLMNPGGHFIVLTPHKWAPMSVVATIVPFWMHNPMKWFIWKTEARDTFPTAYKLNTHADLSGHARRCGLEEAYFSIVDDCSVTIRYRALNWIELRTRRLLNAVGAHHPECCILAVYRKL